MNINPIDRYSLTFSAGLTKQMKSDISNCNVRTIENFFAQKGINADFKNNKVIAWCVLKCCQLINEMNKKYNTNIEMPGTIIAEDFSKLNGFMEEALGATNFLPCYVYKGKQIVIPEKTVFFNIKNANWNNADELADKNFEASISTTDFFLEIFLHEFMHVWHEDNLLNNLSVENFLKFLRHYDNAETVNIFQKKYMQILSKICYYASSHPMETIACDLSKKFIDCINLQDLNITKKFTDNNPYNKKISSKNRDEITKNKILKQIWNGTFFV